MKYNILDSGIRFSMQDSSIDVIQSTPYHFGHEESGFGATVYYRSYSRIMKDGRQEHWPDTVIRVMNGLFTIRKWWYALHNLRWKESNMQALALEMSLSMLQFKWLPPGRGLWIGGTDFAYEKGSAAFINCAYVTIRNLAEDCGWLMNMLMHGEGVGWGISEKRQELFSINNRNREKITIEDSREGWVDSIEKILYSYLDINLPDYDFDYSLIRPQGALLKSFGGTASGPGPLMELHERIRKYCDAYISREYGWTRLTADLCNAIGVAVVAGSSRRSAEIGLGSINDEEFMSLKDYGKHPDRIDVGWMSNNTVKLETKEDFLKLPEIAELIRLNGEPGIMNMVNVREFGRYGDQLKDNAIGGNPCNEIPLYNKETCCLSEVFPSKCESKQEFMDVLRYATFYASTIVLYPSHQEETNAIVAKNRRIGVSLSGISEWFSQWGASKCIRWMRDGYKEVKEYNKIANLDAGVPPSIRLTTVKPSGSISQLVGVTSGIHYPLFNFSIRRIIIEKSSPISQLLINAGYTHEPLVKFVPFNENIEVFKKYYKFAPEGMMSTASDNSLVFEFPIKQSKARPISKVSSWEQLTMAATLSREWADNAVSVTIGFSKSEAKDLEYMLAQFAPLLKSCSFLPHGEENIYPQMPYEGITKEEFNNRILELKPINWNLLDGSDGKFELYCSNEQCEV